ncbi:MAG: lipopolysaccharide biosynthesis protein [Syntrophobacteraceae bacterium]
MKLSPGEWITSFAGVIGRKFIKDATALTTANIVSAGLGFAQGLIVARWLGPEQYGVAALVMSYPSLIYTFFDAKSSDTAVKYIGQHHAESNREGALAICKLGYAVDFGIALLSFLAVAASAGWGARSIIHREEAAGLLTLYAASFLLQSLTGVSYAVLTTLGRFSVIAWLNIASTVLRAVLVLGLTAAGWQVAGVVFGNAFAIAANGLLLWTAARSAARGAWGATPVHGNLRAIGGRLREVLSFMVFSDLNTMIGIVPKRMDLIILGYARGPEQAGYYQLARRLAGAAYNIIAPLQSVTYPEMVRLWAAEDADALRRRVRELLLAVGAPLGAGGIAAAALMPVIILPAFGEAYSPSIPAAALMLIGSAAWATFFWLRPLYLTLGKVREWTAISAMTAFLSLVGVATIAPVWGCTGVGAWWMTTTLITHGAGWIYIMRGRWAGKEAPR